MNTQQLMASLADQDTERLLLAAHARGTQSTTTELGSDIGEEPDYVSELARQLKQVNLVEFLETLGEDYVELSPTGRSVARKIEQSFASGGRRTEAIRRGVLEAMLNKGRVDSMALAQNWTGRHVDPPVDHDEVAQAFEFLKKNDMIRAEGTWQGVFLGIGITSAGRDALEQGVRLVTPGSAPTINDYRDMRDQSNNLTQHGGVMGAVGLGNQNTITGSVTMGPHEVESVRQDLQSALSMVQDVPEIDHQLVTEAIEDALEEVEKDEPKPRMIRRCVDEGLRALSTSTGTAAGASLVGLLQGVLGTL
ncbi:hypothetical protein GMA12_00135 [Kocuria sediminis]|uniref:Uncharacterized protein n=1 Tax=Kocuria sediminis TaxID=1038857 RepID=A0A6N8GEV4_9MICC|nr:hypothetical protein [Kocuria sediminis]MUN61578.1 hypothetical protein [Kocuria sediminis]